jgi:isoleucyl-tRNA synthetase
MCPCLTTSRTRCAASQGSLERLFNAVQYGDRAFRVLNDTYVTDADGTGIVHQAPAFGEDDHRISIAHGVITPEEMPPCPLDDSGRFTSEVPDFAGQNVKVVSCPSPLSQTAQGDPGGG